MTVTAMPVAYARVLSKAAETIPTQRDKHLRNFEDADFDHRCRKSGMPFRVQGM